MKKLTVIRKLSDANLIQNLEVLVKKENELVADILLHLMEVDKRESYLALGYGSLFSYCVQGPLSYSEPAANRRISSARVLNRFPELYDLLLKQEVSLTTLSLVSGVITEQNKSSIIEQIKGKSRREVELVIATLRPKKPVRDSIKPVAVPVQKSNPVGLFEKTDSTEEKGSGEHNQLDGAFSGEGESAPSTGTSECSQKYELRFAVSSDVMDKYREVQSLLSGKYPMGANMEAVLSEVLECYLEKKSPDRRAKRREKRVAIVQKPIRQDNRYVPQGIKDKVYVRDDFRCTYVSPSGVRCSCKWHLQIHHKNPFAKNGEHALENLALLCQKHNLYEAKREFGTAKVLGHFSKQWECTKL
ncbi:HNH endonuclease [Oligoflexia bacterium]|nr:HNH endonuclease [Oligoflexia bacterium]